MQQRILHFTTAHPRHLFAIDGAGALLSALLLALVLPAVQHLIGMPRPALYLLAAFPILFASYDAWCYLRLRRPHAPYLRIVGRTTHLPLSFAHTNRHGLLYGRVAHRAFPGYLRAAYGNHPEHNTTIKPYHHNTRYTPHDHYPYFERFSPTDLRQNPLRRYRSAGAR